MMGMLIDDLKRNKLLSVAKYNGHFKKCIFCGPYVLLHGPIDEEDLELTQQNIKNAKRQNPNLKIADILDWQIDEGAGTCDGVYKSDLPIGWTAQQRAYGQPLGQTDVSRNGVTIDDENEVDVRWQMSLVKMKNYIDNLRISCNATQNQIDEFVDGQFFLKDKNFEGALLKHDPHPGNVNLSPGFGLASFDYSTDQSGVEISNNEFADNMCDIFIPWPNFIRIANNRGEHDTRTILPAHGVNEINELWKENIAPKLKTSLLKHGLESNVEENIDLRMQQIHVVKLHNAVNYIKDLVQETEF